MDADRFDAVTRSLVAARSRRSVLAAALGGLLGALGVRAAPSADAKGKKKRKPCGPCRRRVKGKCKPKPNGTSCGVGKACQGGQCKTSPPTCSDGIKNGSETDVDCGGNCPRCANGKQCAVANDCVSGTCVSGTCAVCTLLQLCGSDAHGSCQCNDAVGTMEPVCRSQNQLGLTVDDCAKCPAGTTVCVTVNGLLFNCYTRCGEA